MNAWTVEHLPRNQWVPSQFLTNLSKLDKKSNKIKEIVPLTNLCQLSSFVSEPSHQKGSSRTICLPPTIGNYWQLSLSQCGGNPNLEAAINLPNTRYLPAHRLWPSAHFDAKLMININQTYFVTPIFKTQNTLGSLRHWKCKVLIDAGEDSVSHAWSSCWS